MPNSDGTKLEVTVFDGEGEALMLFSDSDEGDEEAVDYVSLISPDTYGKPALVAPGKPGDPRAEVGDRVLYINTRLVPMFQIERVKPV